MGGIVLFNKTEIKKAGWAGYLNMKSAASDVEFDSVRKTETDDQIIRRFDRLLTNLANRFSLDEDDLKQVGRIALWEAFQKWKSQPQTAAFWTYARKAVFGEMLDYATREFARAAVEEESGLEPSKPCPPDVAVEAREHIAGLSSREALMVMMREAGFDVPEIADRTAVSAPHVYRLVKGSMEKIRKRA